MNTVELIHQSKSVQWFTPRVYIEAVRRVVDGGARAGLNVSAWRVEVLGKIGRQSTKPKRTAKEAKDDEPYFDDPIPF